MDTITFPPGVVNPASKARRTGSWREVNLVRWEEGNMWPIKGWDLTSLSGFGSTVRTMHRWLDNSGVERTAYLCEEHLYIEASGVLTDVTPSGGITAPPNDEGGYGDYLYGHGDYGTARPGENRLRAYSPIYTLSNWGEELRAMTSSDGRLLKWAPGDAEATAVTNAPVNNRSFVITPERFVILLGAGGVGEKLQWSDQEDDTTWTPGVTNKAGSRRVEPTSPLVVAVRRGSDIVAFTLQGIYTIPYVGLPYIYGLDEKGQATIPISSAMIASLNDRLIWLAVNGIWQFNGVTVEKVFCPIWNWITENMNVRRTIFMGGAIHVSARSEVWFMLASTVNGLPDKVAIYNYVEEWWSMGTLSRICGISPSNTEYPVMSDGTKIYQHEIGFNQYDNYDDLPWAETFSLNLNNGMQISTIYQLFPEVLGDNVDDVKFSFYKSDSRSRDRTETITSKKSIRENGFVDVREKSRDFRMRVEAITPGKWGLGDVGFEMRGAGKRL